MQQRLKILRLTGLFLLTAGGAVAQTPGPGPDRLVHDEAHVLPAATVQRLEQRLERYADSAGVQLAVVTVASLHGQDVGQVGDSLKNAWGVGSKESRRGVLYLVAPQEHRQTIRTGRGLEADLPDALCFRILKQTEPGMGQNLELAIVNRVAAIQQQIARATQAEAERVTPSVAAAPVEEEPSSVVLFGVLLIIAGAGICWASRGTRAAAAKGPKEVPVMDRPFLAKVVSTSSPARRPSPRRSESETGDSLLAAALLASDDEEKKKKSSSSDSWSYWSTGSSDSSGSSDSFSFGGDCDTGGGGGSDGW